MKTKKSKLLLPFVLIGGGIGVFISQTFSAFFIGAAVGIFAGYFLIGLAEQNPANHVDDDKSDGHEEG